MGRNPKNYIYLKSKSGDYTFETFIAMHQVNHNYITYRDMYKQLSNKCKSKITYSTFNAYCNGYAVPNYATAKLIFQSLKFKISEKEIFDLIDESNEKKKVTYENKHSLSTSISIPYKVMNSKIDDESIIREQLEERVREVGENSFSKYVAYLVQKDIDQTFNEGE